MGFHLAGFLKESGQSPSPSFQKAGPRAQEGEEAQPWLKETFILCAL